MFLLKRVEMTIGTHDLFKKKKSFLKFVNLIPEKIKGIGNKMKMTTLFPPHLKKILCPKNE